MGAAGASLALIVANPFAKSSTSFSLPSLPSVSAPASTSAPKKVSEPKPESALAIKQKERYAAKRAELEAKKAAAEAAKSSVKPAKAQKAASTAASEADSYEALFKKAVKEDEEAVAKAKKAEAELKAAEKQVKKDAEAAARRGEKSKIGFGGVTIRHYVLQPEQYVKDTRSGMKTGNPLSVLDGELQPYLDEHLEWLMSGVGASGDDE